MAELITEDQPRIKFQSTREGELSPPSCSELADLAELMVELEQAGVIPVLNDGACTASALLQSWYKPAWIELQAAAEPLPPPRSPGLAAGNCAMRAELCQPSGGPAGSGGTGEREPGGCGAASRPPPIYVSRSGKPPGVAMAAADWVLVTRFDAAAWSASYRSAGLEARPTSDAPLHWGSLVDGACAEYGWGEAPRVAVHGHALAEGPGGPGGHWGRRAAPEDPGGGPWRQVGSSPGCRMRAAPRGRLLRPLQRRLHPPRSLRGSSALPCAHPCTP